MESSTRATLVLLAVLLAHGASAAPRGTRSLRIDTTFKRGQTLPKYTFNMSAIRLDYYDNIIDPDVNPIDKNLKSNISATGKLVANVITREVQVSITGKGTFYDPSKTNVLKAWDPLTVRTSVTINPRGEDSLQSSWAIVRFRGTWKAVKGAPGVFHYTGSATWPLLDPYQFILAVRRCKVLLCVGCTSKGLGSEDGYKGGYFPFLYTDNVQLLEF